MLLLLLLGIASVSASSDPASIDARSGEVLSAASTFYAGLQSFQADGLVSSINEIPSLGVRQDVAEAFTVAMARPGSFSFAKITGYSAGSALITDGKTVTSYLSNQKEYITAPAPPEISQLITPTTALSYGRPLGVFLPFKALLAKYPFSSFTPRLAVGTYIASEKIGTIDTDHLQIVQQNTVTDLWFAIGPFPFLLQFRWTLNRSSSSKSEQTYTFSNWKANPSIPPERFQFKPPAEALSVSAFSTPGLKEDEAPAWLKKPPAAP